ncbi:MAG: hypothetical protein KKH22_12065 [Proteobacteria bacterium]|nr:hypothetical protein [Pseudomonadota bacterium]
MSDITVVISPVQPLTVVLGEGSTPASIIALANAEAAAASALQTTADKAQTGQDVIAAGLAEEGAAAARAAAEAIAANLAAVNGPATETLTVAQVTGTILDNIGQSAPADLQLPPAAAGMNFLMIAGAAGSNAWRLRANAANTFYLNGVAGALNGYVGISAPTVGAYLSVFAFKTGPSTYEWMAVIGNGSWVAS